MEPGLAQFFQNAYNELDCHYMYDELDNFIKWCKKADNPVYIYGDAHRQQMLRKFLDVCEIPFAGYITSASLDCAQLSENDTVILGLSDKYHCEVISLLQGKGITNILNLSEYAKDQICLKLTPKAECDLTLEINLTNHCNLNCQMCDHYSQLADEWNLEPEQYERDIKRMAELTDGKVRLIGLFGGEPLLNPQAAEIMRITRKWMPNSEIMFLTNGLLLLQEEFEEFWCVCRDYSIGLHITLYPVEFDLDAVLKKAEEYNVSVSLFNSYDLEHGIQKKLSWHYPLDLEKSQNEWPAVTCFQFNFGTVLLNGRIYQCPTCAYIENFNKYFGTAVKHTPEDSIDIYEVDSYAEIAEFLSKPIPFCKYCAVGKRSTKPWAPTKRTIDEYTVCE